MMIDAPNPLRIYFVANNPDIAADNIFRGFDPDRDYICQYNFCIFNDVLRRRARNLLYFFSLAASGVPYGFAETGEPLGAFHPPSGGSTGFFIRHEGAVTPDYLDANGAHRTAHMTISLLDPSFVNDRVHRLGPQHQPSAGLTSVALMVLINYWRMARSRAPHRLILHGFTGVYPNGNPFIHDFDKERAFYESHPDVYCLTPTGEQAFAPSPGGADGILATALRRRFSDRYDFTAASKSKLIADLAETFYHVGDFPAFQRLIQASISLNPKQGNREVGLMIRGLAAAGKVAEGADLEATRSRTAARARAIDEKWASGKLKWAPLNAPALASQEAEYVFRSDKRPRMLVLNETSRLGFNRKHLGCVSVSKALVRMLRAHGMEYAGWANSAAGLNEVLAADPARDFDAVLLNGEGTFHGDAARAIELAMAARQMKAAGKKVFLINSVWERNGRFLEEICADFDLIALRESGSLRAAPGLGARMRMTPDLAWITPPVAGEGAQREGCAVIDSVVPETAEALGRLAAANALEFRAMSGLHRSFAAAVRADHPLKSIPTALSDPDLARFGCWITGRFHGLILALVNHAPAVAIPSNTAKIEHMLDDIGLADKICPVDEIHEGARTSQIAGSLRERLIYSPSDWEKVARYQSRATVEIDRLFADMRRLLA
ncbi:polysaccharide pyruvyl transferase family protein [Pikeienuella piscinae]|uniref:Polysaccharide pyruvyl transferase family protein n=1 Tax=Pikeienuella piscinae TaxID=2748098 RepID=A0A7L5BZQ2_9RHOB|nr:polysaccharide pyruvyl transferase family protein [Pikeienuella piscinae]QIE56318.1 polysaccharide pyruvyl transferase family protein [Pikeienuella piscinae]